MSLSASTPTVAHTSRSNLSYALNPFPSLHPPVIAILSPIVLIGLSVLGMQAKTQFPGLFDCLRNSAFSDARAAPSLLLLIYQITMSGVVLSTLIALINKLRRHPVKPLYLISSILFSRFPYVFLASFLAYCETIAPNYIEGLKTQEMLPALPIMIFTTVVSLCVLWQASTYYYAFKQNTDLKGSKLWGMYAIAIILGEIISNTLLLSF